MIIELIGPAGCGKSTLSKALSERCDNIQLRLPPNIRNAGDLPFFVRNAVAALPFLSRIYLSRNGKRPTRKQLIFTLTLNGWHEFLHQNPSQDERYILLDQGPVYMLMILTLFGPQSLIPNAARKYWDHIYRRWAETLDVLVWLDAPLPVLVERIRSREKWHGVKGGGDEAAYDFLESSRKAFQAVISPLEAVSSSIRVIYLDTSASSIQATTEKIIDELQLIGTRKSPVPIF